MLINELSKRTGLPIATLRHYENYGLFKGVSDDSIETNNYKNYDEDVIEKIELIKGAREVGFSLSEIKELLDSWFSKQMTVGRKKAVVNKKIEEIDAKINQLKQVKTTLIGAIKDIENGKC